MVCIYCRSPKLRVINSRAQKRLNQTWRRRQCKSCHAIFTSLEVVDYSRSLVIQPEDGNEIRPFLREKLLISILKSCQHRKAALTDAMALTDTVLQKLLKKSSGTASLQRSLIISTTIDTLKRFDKAAAVQYSAYHPLKLTK